MEELKNSHRMSMLEMRDLLSRQKRLGDRCKSEMEILTKTFEEKSRTLKGKTDDLNDENEDLRLVTTFISKLDSNLFLS